MATTRSKSSLILPLEELELLLDEEELELLLELELEEDELEEDELAEELELLDELELTSPPPQATIERAHTAVKPSRLLTFFISYNIEATIIVRFAFEKPCQYTCGN